jgi:CheY-like chemotaxis protein
MLQRLIGEDIQIKTTLNPNIDQVIVDSAQLSQILMNLAVNARDAMPRGGKLTIKTDNISLDTDYARRHVGIAPGDYVLLSVSDTGIGMNHQTQQHIFEPFFTTKERDQGSGLGLATVYGIVKQSGGNIEVASDLGAGTTFKIYLPRVKKRIPQVKKPDTFVELVAGTETILLVEDEEVVRKLSRRILEICGYNVIETRNGIEALESCAVGDCKFDLLMTDVVMPKMGGSELAEKLRLKLPNLKILFTSGYTNEAVIRHGVKVGNVNFIQKPFSPKQLANKIRKIFDSP